MTKYIIEEYYKSLSHKDYEFYGYISRNTSNDVLSINSQYCRCRLNTTYKESFAKVFPDRESAEKYLGDLESRVIKNYYRFVIKEVLI